MPPKSASASSAHEARIQRLEDHVAELRESHAEVSADLKNLGTQVDAMGNRLADKIDSTLKPLHDTLHDHIKEDTLSRSKLEEVSDKVERIEEERQSRASLWKTVRAGVIAIITGAGAIALKELVVFLAHR